MELIITLIAVTFGILTLILFFKIWGAANDIREIKEKYLSDNQESRKKEGTNE